MRAIHILVNVAANPLGITLGLLILGLVELRRNSRWAKLWLWASVIVTLLMGFNPTVEVMSWWLEKDYPPMRAEDLPPADAIVVLGGGIAGIPKGSSAPYPNLQEGADRIWHAARIWKVHRQAKLKVYCTCPDVTSSTPPFLRDLGVDEECIVPLDGPWNTEAEAKELAVHAPNAKVYLVTSAAHMKRAVRIFHKYAPTLKIVPAATDHFLIDNPNPEITWRYFVPHIGAYSRFNALLHEYLGLVRYW